MTHETDIDRLMAARAWAAHVCDPVALDLTGIDRCFAAQELLAHAIALLNGLSVEQTRSVSLAAINFIYETQRAALALIGGIRSDGATAKTDERPSVTPPKSNVAGLRDDESNVIRMAP